MIVWRGWGLLVLVCAALAGVVVAPIGVFLISQSYPGHPYGADLFRVLQPVMYGALWLAGGLIAGALAWFLGKRINREGNVHTLFFIPAQWWGVVFPLLGAGMLATNMTSGGGVAGAHSSFVTQCAKHEIGANEKTCGCMASIMETKTEPTVFIPFFSEMEDTWRSRHGDENVVQHFIEGYVTTLKPEQSQAFLQAMDEATICFPETGIPAREPLLVPPSAPSVDPAEPETAPAEQETLTPAPI